jgi:AICAR transformylase/IMP cyclohydrolase PurH
MADDGRVLADRQAHRLVVELDRLTCVVLHRVPCGVAHGENVGNVPSDLEVLAYVGGR